MAIRRYFGFDDTDPLFYFINCAVSLDSKLSILGQQVEVSNEEDWTIVHGFRNQIVAIVVGANTIRVDNPSLLTNPEYLKEKEINHPLRVVLGPEKPDRWE